MALIAAADFRTATLAEYAQGISMTTAEASDALLTAAITRQTQRFYDLTNDQFEPDTTTLYLAGSDLSFRLPLPRRCTSVTQVRISNSSGTLTAQTASVYRLRSSLDAAGAKRISANATEDWLELIPYAGGLSGLPSSTAYYTYAWPQDANSVLVTGTFGWTTCPGDVKRAIALLCYDQFKTMRGDLQRAQIIETASQRVDFASTTPTGIPEVDGIIADYKRDVASVLVA